MKRGISPLIATVLLIGFTVTLAAVIMTWGGGFTREEFNITTQECHNERCIIGIVETNQSDEELKNYKLNINVNLSCPECYLPSSCGLIKAKEWLNSSFDINNRVFYVNHSVCEQKEVDTLEVKDEDECTNEKYEKQIKCLNDCPVTLENMSKYNDCLSECHTKKFECDSAIIIYDVISKQDITEKWLDEQVNNGFCECIKNYEEGNYKADIDYYKCGEYIVRKL